MDAGADRASATKKLEFVEVMPSDIAAWPTTKAEQFDVVLGGGSVVRVHARFDAEALRRVVAARGGG